MKSYLIQILSDYLTLYVRHTIFIIMEMCDKGDFSKFLNNRPKEKHALFTPITNGLKYLHEHKIIHRDLNHKIYY